MKVLYFAWMRQRIGHGFETFELPASVSTVSDLVAKLKGLSDGHAEAFRDMSTIKVAVNQEFADLESAIKDTDEVAFFPPVTGG